MWPKLLPAPFSSSNPICSPLTPPAPLLLQHRLTPPPTPPKPTSPPTPPHSLSNPACLSPSPITPHSPSNPPPSPTPLSCPTPPLLHPTPPTANINILLDAAFAENAVQSRSKSFLCEESKDHGIADNGLGVFADDLAVQAQKNLGGDETNEHLAHAWRHQ